MLAESYRPRGWADFVGQPTIEDIVEATSDPWLFESCGERWLFESDGIAGCGKTSAAYVAARALGVADFDIYRIDSRSACVADFRELETSMRFYGMGGRKAYVLDEIQHLNRDCQRMLLGILENLPTHVIMIGTTTSVTWADEIDGLFSRWRRFRFRKPDAKAVAELCERIARERGLPIPDGFNFVRHVQAVGGNNVRAAIENLPDALRRASKREIAA